MDPTRILIIGAGLAGLACAARLTRAGKSCLILEATNRVGGRVGTDRVDGFLLDHSFHTFPTDDPSCRELLGDTSLDLRAFDPHQLVRRGGEFRTVAEPSLGKAEQAIPAQGMAEIPRRLADSLPRRTLRLESTVLRVERDPLTDSQKPPVHRVVLSDEIISAPRVVVATPGDTAARLLNRPELASTWCGATTLYFSAQESPDTRRMRMRCGDEKGPIRAIAVLSDIAPTYAPQGLALISVSVQAEQPVHDSTDDEGLERSIRENLHRWFGEVVCTWDLIRIYRTPYSWPIRSQNNPLAYPSREERPADTIDVIGDYCETPSIAGAMKSGVRLADQILCSSV